MEPIMQSNLNYPLLNRGKVRDIYDCDGNILIFASDRVSAFDVVMNEPIPEKGRVLTAITNFWLDKLQIIVPNHRISDLTFEVPEDMYSRCMLVKKAEVFPVECIVRGYLTGSGKKSYDDSGSICGIKLSEGLVEASLLEEPLFTPTTKAESGHDESMTYAQVEREIGAFNAERVKYLSITLYKAARDIAREHGVILADTKFEFGMYENNIILIDEVLTPDSSRYWPADDYKEGQKQKSFDKQFVRDYLSTLDWDKTPPPPKLPDEIIQKTSEKYLALMKKFNLE